MLKALGESLHEYKSRNVDGVASSPSWDSNHQLLQTVKKTLGNAREHHSSFISVLQWITKNLLKEEFHQLGFELIEILLCAVYSSTDCNTKEEGSSEDRWDEDVGEEEADWGEDTHGGLKGEWNSEDDDTNNEEFNTYYEEKGAKPTESKEGGKVMNTPCEHPEIRKAAMSSLLWLCRNCPPRETMLLLENGLSAMRNADAFVEGSVVVDEAVRGTVLFEDSLLLFQTAFKIMKPSRRRSMHLQSFTEVIKLQLVRIREAVIHVRSLVKKKSQGDAFAYESCSRHIVSFGDSVENSFKCYLKASVNFSSEIFTKLQRDGMEESETTVELAFLKLLLIIMRFRALLRPAEQQNAIMKRLSDLTTKMLGTLKIEPFRFCYDHVVRNRESIFKKIVGLPLSFFNNQDQQTETEGEEENKALLSKDSKRQQQHHQNDNCGYFSSSNLDVTGLASYVCYVGDKAIGQTSNFSKTQQQDQQQEEKVERRPRALHMLTSVIVSLTLSGKDLPELRLLRRRLTVQLQNRTGVVIDESRINDILAALALMLNYNSEALFDTSTEVGEAEAAREEVILIQGIMAEIAPKHVSRLYKALLLAPLDNALTAATTTTAATTSTALQFALVRVLKDLLRTKWLRTDSTKEEHLASQHAVELIDQFIAMVSIRISFMDARIIAETCSIVASAIGLRRFVFMRDKDGKMTKIRTYKSKKSFRGTTLPSLKKAAKKLGDAIYHRVLVLDGRIKDGDDAQLNNSSSDSNAGTNLMTTTTTGDICQPICCSNGLASRDDLVGVLERLKSLLITIKHAFLDFENPSSSKYNYFAPVIGGKRMASCGECRT